MTITPKNKLIRDNIPNSITDKNITPKLVILDESTFQKEIFNKLVDEAKEVIESQNDTEHLQEELADVLEVVDTIVKLKNLNFEQIKQTQINKREQWGSFDKKSGSNQLPKKNNQATLRMSTAG